MGATGSNTYSSGAFDGAFNLNIDTSTLPGGTGWTPEQQNNLAVGLSKLAEQNAMLPPVPTPPPQTIDPIDLAKSVAAGWGVTASDYTTNLAFQGTSQYTQTIFDKLKATVSGIMPYSLIGSNRNVESYVTFYEGPTKYYTGSENIDELRALGYTISKDPVTREYNALLYQDQIKDDLPPTQYIPGDSVTWTDDMGRDPRTGAPREVTVPVPPPIIPHFPTQKDVTPTAPDYTPLYVLGGAIALYVIAKK